MGELERVDQEWMGTGDDGAAGTEAETNDAETREDGEKVCNLQQLFQELLGVMRLREEGVPPSAASATRGPAVMSSLGALSQAIDEYDLLRFRRSPAEKLADFADWLQGEAPPVLRGPGGDFRERRHGAGRAGRRGGQHGPSVKRKRMGLYLRCRHGRGALPS